MTDELPDVGGPLGAHLPGDLVAIPSFDFTHEMNVDSVSATFVHQDDPNEIIVLRGYRHKKANDKPNPQSGTVVKRSSVQLKGTIPSEAAAGQYRCQTIKAHTFAGNEIPFDDPRNEVDFELWVLLEPQTPPKFGLGG